MKTRHAHRARFAIIGAATFAATALCAVHAARAGDGAATTQVVVADGQVLTGDDLEAGEFDGVTFTLDETLTIDIESGGALAPLYSPTIFDFGLGGATINARSGSVIQSDLPSAESSWLRHVTLNVEAGATVGAGLRVSGWTGPTSINVHGGQIGQALWTSDAAITIHDGSIGADFNHSSGSVIGTTLTMLGGTIGDGFHMGGGFSFPFMDPPFSMSGGTIGNSMTITGRGLVTGGAIGDGLKVGNGTASGAGALTIAGGTIGSGMYVGIYVTSSKQFAGNQLHLMVTELRLDGEPVDLIVDVPLLITERGGALLEATLADGSPFDLVLNDVAKPGQDYVAALATLTATRVAPTGDLNGDGIVDGADLGILLNNWGGDGPGDLNGDGIVDGADLGILLNNWG